MSNRLAIATVAALLPLTLALPALATVNASASSTAPMSGVHNGTVHGKKVVKTLQGTVKAIGSGSFILAVRNTDYTVTVGTSARVTNRTWQKIGLSDIKVGDKVRVFGAVSGTAIMAQIVRNISLPAPAGNATSTSTH